MSLRKSDSALKIKRRLHRKNRPASGERCTSPSPENVPKLNLLELQHSFAKFNKRYSLDKKPQQVGESARTRVVPDVPAPTWKNLSIDELYPHYDAAHQHYNVPDVQVLKNHFLNEGRLELSVAFKLVNQVTGLLQSEPNLRELKAPVHVFGDIHGQYFDLIHLLKEVDSLEDNPSANYLFLGDYVDRGCFSTEVVLFLFALKIKYPTRVTLLRGNHECRMLTGHFNFLSECKHKYDTELYLAIMRCFDCLPLAAVIQSDLGNFFCCHGGLSPDVEKLQDINEIHRFREIPREGALCDILWSDPIEEDYVTDLSEEDRQEWKEVGYVHNINRGCGYVYGYTATKVFLENNNLVSIIRAHEVQEDGYLLHRLFDSEREHPMIITVFSAPNYCDIYQNKAAFLKIELDSYKFVQVESVPHPFYLPNLMDGISYSIPFVVENLSVLFFDFVEYLCKDDDDEVSCSLKEKLAAATTTLATLRKWRTTHAHVKDLVKRIGLSPRDVSAFKNARSSDSENEMLPQKFRKQQSTDSLPVWLTPRRDRGLSL